MPQRPPLSQIIIYTFGQLGWSLALYGAANFLTYFYMPPVEGGREIFPTFIYQGAVLGIATLIGLIGSMGRIFDAITDPLIAAWSDKRPNKGGKRTRLMGWAALPLALLSFLIFFPPSQEAGAFNTCWVALMVLLFYFFYTMYVIPYLALISELGHDPRDLIPISTISSVGWALGFIIGSMGYGMQAWLEQYMAATQAFQLTLGIFAAVSLVCMLVPVFFLKEELYAYQPQNEEGTLVSMWASVKEVLLQKGYGYFIFADLLYWLALTFIQQGVSYYVTALFEFPKEQATQFITISFLASFLFYWPLNGMVKRWGKRRIMLSAYLVFSVVFVGLSAFKALGWPAGVVFYGLSLLSAYPLAVFGIVPMAIIADYVNRQASETGKQQTAMFFAVRNFFQKTGMTLGVLLFPSLLLMGKSANAPTGVVVSAVLAAIFCTLGWYFFRKSGAN